MDSESPSPNKESNELKAEFRKPANETANRKYRRRSPVGGSSDEDGSPRRDHSSRGKSKVSDPARRYADRPEDKSSSRSQHGHSSDSYRHSSRAYDDSHDASTRHGRHANEAERAHGKPSSRSGRDLRVGNHSDYRDRDGDYNRSRDHRDADRYSRDRSDVADRKYKDKDIPSDRAGYEGKRGNRYEDRDRRGRDKYERDEKQDYRSHRDQKSDHSASYEESRGHRGDSTSTKEANGGSKYSQEGKNSIDKQEKDKYSEAGGKSDDKSGSLTEGVTTKRPKLFSSEVNDEKKADADQLAAKMALDEAPVNGAAAAADVDTAKVAALKAAELVNKNLVGTGFMTAEQKKKLLWGNKKSNAAEEPSRLWEKPLFSDRERQEKFNKLMGVKGDAKLESKQMSSEDIEKQREQLQLDLEKQYTAGLRRRDGRTVGLGL